MKKTLLSLWFSALISFLVVFPALAQQGAPPDSGDDRFGLEATRGAAELPEKELPVFIGELISAGLGVLGIIFFIFMLYGGFIWMKARGNEQEVEKAKNVLTNSIIGIVIIAAAYAITAFVIRALS